MTAFEEIGFDATAGRAVLRELPTVPAVFALYGAEAKDEPYVGRTPNLRGRLERLLMPSEKHPRRLQLASRVKRIQWQRTGSEFESFLAQFNLLEEIFGGDRAVERMHLRAPAFLRYLGSNRYPRVAVTTRPSAREADWAYGPFASRAAAERYLEEALKLFNLRRCVEDLEPDPQHPGCVYSEMKMCLAPCFGGCTDARYAEEAAAVERFLATRGESRLVELRTARDAASDELEFEKAALLHAQVARVEGIRALAPELVRPASAQRAIVLQAAAEPGSVAVFLFENGRLRGPGLYSTLGMRIQNEQSGSSSLFAQPMAILPVPEEQGTREQGAREQGTREQGNEGLGTRDCEVAQTGNREQEIENSADAGLENDAAEVRSAAPSPAARKQMRDLLEARWEDLLADLAVWGGVPSAAVRQGHMALVKRWYYRPEVKRVGEIFFPDEDGQWPVKSILRGIGRVAARAMDGQQSY
jgi:excinuclease UvrABC nuclease subunit